MLFGMYNMNAVKEKKSETVQFQCNLALAIITLCMQ